MNDEHPLRVYDDQHVHLDHVAEWALPGYLILRFHDAASSFADLAPPLAAHVGTVLARAVRAIETAVGAERVYCLSFCEVDRRLHLHLCPRSASLLAEYQRATDTSCQAVDAPRLFAWARERYPAGSEPPPGQLPVAAVCARLAAILGSEALG